MRRINTATEKSCVCFNKKKKKIFVFFVKFSRSIRKLTYESRADHWRNQVRFWVSSVVLLSKPRYTLSLHRQTISKIRSISRDRRRRSISLHCLLQIAFSRIVYIFVFLHNCHYYIIFIKFLQNSFYTSLSFSEKMYVCENYTNRIIFIRQFRQIFWIIPRVQIWW